MKQRPTDLLHGKPEGCDVGALEGGRVPPVDCALFRSLPFVDTRDTGETGGIQPARRRRSRLALTLAEREEISRACGRSVDPFE